MTGTDPLLKAVRDLGDTTVADDTIEVSLPDQTYARRPEGVSPTFRLSVGLYDLLAEATLAGDLDDADREAILREALTDISSIEPVLRFTLYDRSRRTEQLERAARMRSRQNAATHRWLVPRLEAEIETYEARVLALRRALEGTSR